MFTAQYGPIPTLDVFAKEAGSSQTCWDAWQRSWQQASNTPPLPASPSQQTFTLSSVNRADEVMNSREGNNEAETRREKSPTSTNTEDQVQAAEGPALMVDVLQIWT